MIDIRIIETPSDCRYMTIAECIADNASRHFMRGIVWLAAGFPSHALGSWRKATRNNAVSRTLANVEM